MIYNILLLKTDKKKIEDNQCENDFINFNDIIPNHYIGRKNNDILR